MDDVSGNNPLGRNAQTSLVSREEFNKAQAWFGDFSLMCFPWTAFLGINPMRSIEPVGERLNATDPRNAVYNLNPRGGP
jgi:hypothetical protein